MSNKSTLKKIGYVTFSNVVKLVSSILIGFIIPNILGVTNYGYYKVFTLYLTYIGLFHFGFIDGIYLKFGGVDYKDLSRSKFRSYFKFLLLFELLIAIVGITVIQLWMNGDRAFIFTLLLINLIAINLTTYFQFISQITSRFREYSSRLIILSFTNIIIVGIMYYFGLSSYKFYSGLIVLVNFLLLFWYVYTYRQIVFGKSESLSESKNDIIDYFKIGIPLLVANLASTFVMTVDKQIVELLFPVEEFGVYSFAYSMLVMVTVVVSAVGIVLYPTLKKVSIESIPNYYHKLMRIIIVVVLFGLFGYFPLLWVVPKFLPNYVGSLIIFRIALPGLLFTSTITAIKHNIFKITNKNVHFFWISFLAIITNIVLNLAAYYFYGTKESIAITSIIGLGLWYASTELYIIRTHHVKWRLNCLLILLGLSLFYILSGIQNYVIAGFIYVVFTMLITGTIYIKEISVLWNRVISKNSNNE